MTNSIISFTDPVSGEARQIDMSAGIMLTTGADGQTTEMRVESGDQMLSEQLAVFADRNDRAKRMSAWEGRSVTMDIGISDVHQDAPIPNYAAGYRQMGMVADMASPVVQVTKPSNKYYTWNQDDAFQAVDNTETAPGAHVQEISPRLSNSLYVTTERALGSFVPTEVEAAADAPLRVFQRAVTNCQMRLELAREQRVASLLTTAANYAAAQVNDLSGTPTAKWDGGSASDPIANLHQLIENALLEPTDIVMSRRTYNAFVRNSAVQKYIASKNTVAPVPSASDWAPLLQLPPITVATLKAKNKATGATYDYIWGNDVVLLRRPPGGVPVDGQDVGSSYTFRWGNSATSDGQVSNGWLVRTFFDMKRGPKGGMMVVVVHQDAEILTSALVGGVIKAAWQLAMPASDYRADLHVGVASKTYAAIPGVDTDLTSGAALAAGIPAQCARRIRVGVAGTVGVVYSDGCLDTISALAGETLSGLFKTLKAGGSATNLTVVW